MTSMLRTSDFDYDLPPDRIAQHPAPERDASRLLALDRATGARTHLAFRDLPSLIHEGDLLVVNDTRVIPARLFGRLRRAETGPAATGPATGQVSGSLSGLPSGPSPVPSIRDREVEIFLLREEPAVPPERIWTALARPAKSVRVGAAVHFSDPSYSAHVVGLGERGIRHVTFRPRAQGFRCAPERAGEAGSRSPQLSPGTVRPESPEQGQLAPERVEAGDVTSGQLAPAQVVSFETWLSRVGHIPLPPYIGRPDEPEDRERYQTIFARDPGSVAAPTAGLHFTEEVTAAIRARGATIASVTLHVGPGTFRPVATEDPKEHVLDSEPYRVPPDTAAAIRAVRELRRAGGPGRTGPGQPPVEQPRPGHPAQEHNRPEPGRIIAVGTTAVRALESWALAGEPDDGAWRETGLFILPPYDFRVIDGMVTNFHLPKSSLLMLVSALAGRERILSAYREAVAEEYRFYSYGDAMLIL